MIRKRLLNFKKGKWRIWRNEIEEENQRLVKQKREGGGEDEDENGWSKVLFSKCLSNFDEATRKPNAWHSVLLTNQKKISYRPVCLYSIYW